MAEAAARAPLDPRRQPQFPAASGHGPCPVLLQVSIGKSLLIMQHELTNKIRTTMTRRCHSLYCATDHAVQCSMLTYDAVGTFGAFKFKFRTSDSGVRFVGGPV